MGNLIKAQTESWGARAAQPQLEEIQRFAEQIHRLNEGELDPDDFKKFRLENGIYGIRGTTDEHMIRVKVKYGVFTAEQMEVLATLAERYADPKVGHITTRQNFQFHHIKRAEVPGILQQIAEVGLTSREACGNTVRSVTGCPYAGVSATEAFNVVPYAEATARYFLRHSVC
ncbi:MAG: nitrite/sulfite reductase, partial [Candidatus Omnitrophica bacterium]|nr:nitrite/sulfite reductase [Candidatus Omnitrophota bacterium]